MLHILLTILKVIGIILLVILALIIALILIVLFVPFRYRVHAKKEGGPPEAEGRITWLLKLLRVEVKYRDKSGRADIKVLRFTLKSIRIPAGEGHLQEKPKPGEGNSQKNSDSGERHQQEVFGQGEDPVKNKPAEIASAKKTEATSALDQSSDGKKKPAKDKAIPDKAQSDAADKTTSSKAAAEPTSEGADNSKESSKENRISSVIRSVLSVLPGRITRIVEKVCDILLRLLDLPFEVYDKVDDGIDRVDRKIRAIQYKIQPFLTIEAEHMLRKLIGYALYLIHGWKPRRIRGYIEFGTGQPDVTGKLTGLIYLLLPEEADRFDIRPDFYEKRFRTDVTMSGHIRLYRAFVVAVKVLLDREFWELLRMIRHKPPKKKKKRRVRRVN